MGCRQRSARHAENKRQKMEKKCVGTTSGTLGFRICGMQSYDLESNALVFYDKYWGQKVSTETAAEAIAFFFPGGRDVGATRHGSACLTALRTVILEKLLEQLAELREVILRLHGLRF